MRFKMIRAVMFPVLLASTLHAAEPIWVGTWSAAPYDVGTNNMPPSPGLNGNSLRQIVRVSIGGDTIRVKFSNDVGNAALTMNAATVAISSAGKDAIDASTLKPLKFNGTAKVTIAAKSTVVSDPIAFRLAPGAKVAITIHYGQIPSPLTGHVGARTPSYLLTGDKTTAANFSGAASLERWYTINTIDVRAPATAGAVGVIGNSITDGYGLTGGLHNRWTDVFSAALLANAATANVGVLNMGIGGTNVASGATGGLSRYKRDIFGQSGLRWFIVFYGVNDIGGGANATTITNAYKQMIADARAAGVKVYGATITPFGGNSYYTVPHEQVRSAVNAWIRTSGNFDGVIDFDKALRNPSDTTRLQAKYNNDGLHPNVEGYKAIGNAVDVKLFASVPSSVDRGPFAAGHRLGAPAASLSLDDKTLSVEFDGRRLDGRHAPR